MKKVHFPKLPRLPWSRRTIRAADRKTQNTNALKGLPEPPWLEQPLRSSLENNLTALRDIFKDCSDIVYRELMISPERKGMLAYVEGTVKSEDLQDHILRPFILGMMLKDPEVNGTLDPLDETRISMSQTKTMDQWKMVSAAILDGNAALFVDGTPRAYIFSAKGGVRRGVEEPQTEAVIRGPREGFTETIRVNTALLRFKLKTSKLKMQSMTIGKETQTSIVLTYIEGIIDPKLVGDVKKRLSDIKIDGVLDTGYIEELIEDHPFSPFPQMEYTERPDTVTAELLEGRFAILVDGTPFALIGPTTMWMMMQASEDYYERFFISNMIRWIRFLFLILALFLPALYVAITTYHHDMLPTTLVLSIAAARESIPFPALVEALMMEISFEALREAGIRLPKTVGQAVSILGALVIGQAAVQAGIVSAPIVIVVSLTGIASFTIPRFNFAITIRLLRFPIMLMAGVFGLFGIIIATTLIATHLTKLTSFGVPYMSGYSPYNHNDQKDIVVRAPWWKMIKRPSWIGSDNNKREKEKMNGSPGTEEGW
ncbi:spore germination protein [Paenibacillus kribbensis]|uniref:spore germination protein n=1 Tax=Paenibacillus TaxID=44249 RepID=UPI00024F031F|nr:MULTISPECIES: spore germination protein [Paenibacillus]EHS55077.1 gera family spore germination protein [Paenibacillus sp. Aloe-11]MEC0235400.1 spore germination protein [Paenibacillus kribbensis]